MLYRARSNRALISRSGGMLGRPVWPYALEKSRDMRLRIASARLLIDRKGWLAGIRSSTLNV